MTGILDALIVVLLVGAAAAWLGWTLFGPGRAKASCASGCGKCAEARSEPPKPEPGQRVPLRVLSGTGHDRSGQ